jgi:hypothetical protein
VCERDAVVRSRISGVSIGGVPLRPGQHCLYMDASGGVTRFGTILNMFHSIDEMMDDFVIFQIENKPITTRMGHYCLFSNVSDSTVLVFWSQVIWKCKAFKVEGGRANMALPFVSCTSRELMEFK